jgi:hypothetical protein
VLKLSIVTKGGLSLAEIPRSSEETDRQLASGLMAALISFSQEVHKAELQSLNFHDRTVSFIPVGEFFIVAEMTSSADNDLLMRILGGMKDRASNLLQEQSQMSLSTEEAEDIVGQIGSLDWINETLETLGYKRPLADGTIHHFLLKPNQEIESMTATNPEFFQTIAALIIKGQGTANRLTETIKAFVPISNPPSALYLIAQPIETGIDVSLLKIDVGVSHTLFRLVPVLDREYDKIKALYPNFGSIKLMEQLKSTHDYTKKKFDKFDENEISLGFLQKNVKKNLDHAIFSVIVGDRVAIIGDKPSVRIVSNSLALFAQHRVTDIVDWLEEDKMGHNITGMSIDKYNTLVRLGEIDDTATVINLDKSTVNGGQSNKFIKKLFDRIKKLDVASAREIIYLELDLLVSYALNVTMLVMLSLEEAIENLEQLKHNIKDNPKFDLIMELAEQRNPWLKSLISELSASLKTAEDYLADF